MQSEMWQAVLRTKGEMYNGLIRRKYLWSPAHGSLQGNQIVFEDL